MEAYKQAQSQAASMRSGQRKTGPSWEFRGPLNIGGRITAMAVDPTRFDTIYLGGATGGVIKSIDGGSSWQPIFDDIPSLSIGAMVMDPSDPETLYVGTGEANGGGGSVSYGGSGVYRTTDGGNSWQHLGLEDSHHIGRIVVNPNDPDVIFVAVVGLLYGTNSERGVYRSTNGGDTWERVLFLSEQTGCIDLVVNPDNPNILYAAMWERERGPDFRDYGGEECGVWRSLDGGDTWQELVSGLPNNQADVGRIGLAIARSNPQVLYAIYADNIGFFDGVYRSDDGGDSWSRTNDGNLSNLYSSFGWWFGNIRVDPADPNSVYVLGLDVYKTTNGGNSWFFSSGSMHVDQHDLIVHPQDSSWVLAGNDGGAYISQNGGSSYTKLPNIPFTQFYTCEIDFQNPERIYGGTQDNGTNRTLTGNLDDWSRIWGGDGFYVLVDPTDNQFVYAESQFGGLVRSTNGGTTFFGATAGVIGTDRNNWNSPLVMDPNQSQTLYFGTQRVYRSTNRAASWNAISGDLSDGPGGGNLTFGTVTTIAVAASDDQVIYAGTDDGNLWVTQNLGDTWTSISDGLPKRWITRVAVSPDDASIAYVTLSGFRESKNLPHIFKTNDAGQSWVDISHNLPEAPLNDVIVDPASPNQVFVAGDLGVYRSRNTAGDWALLGMGLPLAPVADMTFHHPTRTLLAGTYGRSMYSIVVEDGCFSETEIQTAVENWGMETNVLQLLHFYTHQCSL